MGIWEQLCIILSSQVKMRIIKIHDNIYHMYTFILCQIKPHNLTVKVFVFPVSFQGRKGKFSMKCPW